MMYSPATIDAWHIHPMEIVAIHSEIEGVATYDLRFANPSQHSSYAFLPGQFNMLYMPGVGEAAISMSGAVAEASLWRHTVRVAGRVTSTLAQLQVGQTIGVRGPFGQSWPLDNWRGDDVVLVAGGIGLAPVRPIIYELIRRRAEFGRITLIYGARFPETLLYTAEYAAWAKAGLDVLTTVDRASPDWQGNQGVVTVLLDRLPLPRPAQTHLAMCGPEVMMHYTAINAIKRGLSEDHLWLSLERNMQCAAGFCGHCQLGPKFVCKDGPVFRADHIRPLLSVEAL